MPFLHYPPDGQPPNIEELQNPISIEECRDKQAIREKVWRYMEENNLLSSTPAFGTIPDFKDAQTVCKALSEFDFFTKSKSIKINTDRPMKWARFLALQANKKVIVPTPWLGIDNGYPFHEVKLPHNDPLTISYVSQTSFLETGSEGILLNLFAKPVDKIDLVVVGSVAVGLCGHCIGKGGGQADLEQAILRDVGSFVPRQTLVVTLVDECQLFNELPPSMFTPRDMFINIIITPARVVLIENNPPIVGIDWSVIRPEQLETMSWLTNAQLS